MATTYGSDVWDIVDKRLSEYPHINTDRVCHRVSCLLQATLEGAIEDELDNYEPPEPQGIDYPFADNH